MGLEMKTVCERCESKVYDEAYICVHECTFCKGCTSAMSNRCPNCSGELVRRPRATKGACPITVRGNVL
ncbi:DUF1272 domain-containing protein [Pseudalkalibacillus sp. SCS-8]|uniref:DUF1272 domain-containing protein n=1 Tax=Pseudalkalibacillus nanhaiensis TaxID=3115291 RepID=UPI0032DB643E